MEYSTGPDDWPRDSMRLRSPSSMSQVAGQASDLVKSLTFPKMKAGSVSSARKLPARKASGGANSDRPFWLRSFMACSLAAMAAPQIATTIAAPRSMHPYRRIPPLL